MTKQTLVTAGLFGLLALLGPIPAREARGQVVFQAAGPNTASISGTLDAFRAELGGINNASNPGPLATGRREINWDGGGGVDTTTDPVTPFTVFLNTRGGLFTTPGTGLTQAPPSGGPQGGLAGLFGNPSYGTTFAAFSPLRVFAPVGSRITDATFFVPGSNGTAPATVTGFGAVFVDVDKPDGVNRQGRTTQVQYFNVDGELIFSGFAPSAPGDGGFSFFGVVFPDARIARVRIRTGDVPLGPDDDPKDIVVMDDFLYGEPQGLSVP